MIDRFHFVPFYPMTSLSPQRVLAAGVSPLVCVCLCRGWGLVKVNALHTWRCESVSKEMMMSAWKLG